MKFKDSRIIPLDKQVDKAPTLIPKLPFTLSIVANKGSGKSNLILNMLLNPNLLNKKFNRILIISPTRKLDKKWLVLDRYDVTTLNRPLINLLKKKSRNSIFAKDNVNQSFENYIENYDEPNIKILDDLITEQNYIIRSYGKDIADKILVVLDDCVSFKKFFNSDGFRKFIFNSRHYNISCIVTSQTYFSIPKPIRLNTSGICLFFNGNDNDIKLIYEENSCKLNFKEFLAMYKKPLLASLFFAGSSVAHLSKLNDGLVDYLWYKDISGLNGEWVVKEEGKNSWYSLNSNRTGSIQLIQSAAEYLALPSKPTDGMLGKPKDLNIDGVAVKYMDSHMTPEEFIGNSTASAIHAKPVEDTIIYCVIQFCTQPPKSKE
ncbi:hypothetical protein HDV01_007851 [Terramyces sp. JEL0728]|nr:hypothetical protein HDV01_007851 [Terramyces sp. JEL0728]